MEKDIIVNASLKNTDVEKALKKVEELKKRIKEVNHLARQLTSLVSNLKLEIEVDV